MRKLIVTTGQPNYITGVYLPTLFSRARYDGDVLIIDYGEYNTGYQMAVARFPNVRLVRQEQFFECLCSDRIRAFYEALKPIYQDYDVIMVTDGNDIEFYKPVVSLFEQAKEKVRYVEEEEGHKMRVWLHYTDFGFPNAQEVWSKIKNRLMINAGMFIGPAKQIMSILFFIADNMKYNGKFGADQLLLNAFIYYYKFPAESIGFEWNYVLLASGRRPVQEQKGKVYAVEDGREICILHRNGIGHLDAKKYKEFLYPAV